MKTRHILTALALPALFAACTADEFVNEGISTQGSHAKLSKDLTLTTLGEADTRYSVSDNMVISFEAGDKLGACIIDEYEPAKQDPKDWKVIPSLAGNYPFTFDGSVWKSDIELGIGHYLFVYPYNKSDNNRAAASFELPVVQELYDTEDGPVVLGAAIQKGNKAIAATVMYEGDTEKDIKMYNLYTYPKFVINFDNGEKVTTVSQVVLKDATSNSGEGFMVKGGFDHEALAKMAQNDPSLYTESYWNSDNRCVDWNKVQTSDMVLSSTSTNASYTKFGYSNYIIAKLPNNTKVKVDDTTNNKYVEVSFMMPSVESLPTYGGIAMYVYTDNGIYQAYLNQNSIDFKSTTSAATKASVLSRSMGLTLRMKKMDSYDKVNETTVGYIVTNKADWNEMVAKYGATTGRVNINIAGSDFAFEEGVEMPSKATFVVGTAVSVKGNMTLKNVEVNANLTVEEGAVLTTDPTFEATNIINKGAIIFTAMPETRAAVANTYTGVSAIANANMVTVPAGVNAQFSIENADGATLENNGEVTLTSGSTNLGTINNAGVLNVQGLTNDVDEYNAQTGEYDVVGNINNAKGAEIVSEAAAGLVNNANAVITNEGSISSLSSNSATIENAGILYAKGEVNYLTDNTSTGKIVVYKAMPDNVVLTNSNAGIVEYTATKASEAFEAGSEKSIVTKVIANGNLAITKVGYVNNLIINGTSTLSVEANKNIATVTIAAGTTTLGSDLNVTNLNVAKGAKVIVNAGKTLNVVTGLTNEGAIQVGGTFKATNVSSANGGTVTQSGTSSKVIWKENADEESAAQAQKDAAMEAVVNFWAQNWGTYVSGSRTAIYDGNPYYYAGMMFALNTGSAPQWATLKANLKAAGFTDANLKQDKPTEPAEFKTAVNKLLNTKKAAAEAVLFNFENGQIKDFKYSLTADATLYDTEAKAKDGLCTTIAKNGSSFAGDYVAAAYAWTIQSTVYSKAIAKYPTNFIWKGCTLDKLVDIWYTYDALGLAVTTNYTYNYVIANYDSSLNATDMNLAATVILWVKEVLTSTSTGVPALVEAQNSLAEIGIKSSNINSYAAYTNAQVAAVDESATGLQTTIIP